jgi:hypothetical protein
MTRSLAINAKVSCPGTCINSIFHSSYSNFSDKIGVTSANVLQSTSPNSMQHSCTAHAQYSHISRPTKPHHDQPTAIAGQPTQISCQTPPIIISLKSAAQRSSSQPCAAQRWQLLLLFIMVRPCFFFLSFIFLLYVLINLLLHTPTHTGGRRIIK